MKELSIEEKAQRYDKALEKSKRLYEQGTITESLCYVFPELKESEDERMKKIISDILRITDNDEIMEILDANNVLIQDVYAWLEKQDEPTEINPSEFDSQLNRLLKQFESLPKEYLASSLSFYLNVVQNDGTYKKEKQGEHNPVIKMKTPEESLGIDSDTYNKIVDECVYGKQKSAWSEEDEKELCRVIYMMEQLDLTESWSDCYTFLNSLKDKVQPQNTWKPSDEQMKALEIAIRWGIQLGTWEESALNSLFNNLKKLRA